MSGFPAPLEEGGKKEEEEGGDIGLIFVWLRPGQVHHLDEGVLGEGGQPGEDEEGVAVHVDLN